MDPLSIVASVSQLALLAGDLTKVVTRFVVEYKNLPQSVKELYEQLSSLQDVIGLIRGLFEKRKQPLDFELPHYEIVHRIIRKCEGVLKELDNQLPELKDKTSPLEKVILTLEKSIKDSRVRELLTRLDSYTSLVQASLATVSLGLQLDERKSHEQIKHSIRKLVDLIQSKPLFSGRDKRVQQTAASSASSTIENDYEVIETEKTTLDEDIRAWRETAGDVANAVSDSLSELPCTEFDNNSIPPTTSISGDSTSLFNDVFGNDPDHEDIPSRDILEEYIKANQNMVQRFCEEKIFLQASRLQKGGIEMCEQLARDGQECSYDLAYMKERLADILFGCDNRESDEEAKVVLETLLRAEVNQPDGQRNKARMFRLAHKLGSFFFKYGNYTEAEKFLYKAFGGRKDMEPRPDEEVAESAELLINIYRALQAFDKARGLLEWLRREIRRSSDSSSLASTADNVGVNLSNAYQWCKEKRLRVDDPTFAFDVWALPFRTTPMHLAIEAEKIEVLRDMLSHVSHVEPYDENRATPLHQAAATRNRHITQLLLDHNADVNALDRNEMTPLHRCQSKEGGSRVAELLLQACPELVDKMNRFGKTALFMACEMSNEKMVNCLLERRANPNIKGPGGCTPLLAVIDGNQNPAPKIAIVKLLTEHGANPYIPNHDSRTALDAARNTGLASRQIKDLLNGVARNFQRQGSNASSTTPRRPNMSAIRSWASR